MIADMVFQIIFTVEMVLKIIALGFLFKPYSYMRDAWNMVREHTLTSLVGLCGRYNGMD
jgi:hypothetical protein